jgi:hypothetical protein
MKLQKYADSAVEQQFVRSYKEPPENRESGPRLREGKNVVVGSRKGSETRGAADNSKVATHYYFSRLGKKMSS